MRTVISDLGDLVLGIALTFAFLIVIVEWAERRREGRRQQLILDAIEREYEAYRRMQLF